MLANILRSTLGCMAAIAACSFLTSNIHAQTAQGTAPPSVHVPPQQGTQPDAPPVFYKLGDSTNIQRAAEPGMQFAPRPDQATRMVNTSQPQVQQASWETQEIANQASEISAIKPATMPSLLGGDAPLLPRNQALEAARNRMGSALPGSTNPQSPSAVSSNADALRPPPRFGNNGGDLEIASQPLRGPQPTANSLVPPPAPQSANTQTGPTQINVQPAMRPPVAAQPSPETATVMGVKSDVIVIKPANEATANPGMYVSAQQPVPPASSQSPIRNGVNGETASLKMAIPSLEIEAFGPGTVGIHKQVQYRIVATNRDRIDAQRISVALNLPGWVQVQNVNTTAGRRENTPDQATSRVNWMIDRIPAGESCTMVVDVIPTKAEAFDLAMDWAMQPASAASRVGVTEPRLEMNIAGPNEVLYGETAVYNVTVRNPGTGMAEEVAVMLPEALGGEKANLGNIPPGEERTFQVELLARAAGQLDLTTSATARGNLQASSTRNIVVRRPQLDVQITGPGMKYAGANSEYDITVRNSGDATGRDIIAAIALPAGVQYLGGIDGAEAVENGLKWTIGTLDIGDMRKYRISCQMNVDGQVGIEVAARGSGEIASISRCTTVVETIADLVLSVEDPKGPLPLNQKIDYVIRIKNRGTCSAEKLDLVFLFSDGIEPSSAGGLGNQVEPGKVAFAPIPLIEPGQEIVLTVTAQATLAGTHKFRAQLTGTTTDAHEVAEGTTRFYGDGTNRTAEGPANGTGNGIR